MIRVRSPQNLVGGLLLLALACLAFWASSDLEVGRAMRMGPGYLPRALVFLIAASGLVIIAMGFLADGPPLERWHLGRLALLLASIIIFAYGIRQLGLIVTGAILVVVASLAAPDVRRFELMIFTIVLVTFAALLFPIALNLPLPLWPSSFR